MTTHSYSAIKDFEGCARRYYNVRVTKAYKSQDTEATLYGVAAHKAFEDYVKDRTPLPESFSQFEPYVKPITTLPGTVHCEIKLGMTSTFQACDFFSPDAWFRGIPDVLVLDEEKGIARVADYKTSKSSRYADTDQLELMAALVMAHFPAVHKVKGALLFVVARDVIRLDRTREDLPQILSKLAGRVIAIEEAHRSGVWNARPSALCNFCPVVSCEHR